MMMEGEGPQENSSCLLMQLEHILGSDPLIDEVGFVHPTQLMALNGGSAGSLDASANNFQQSSDHVVDTDILLYENSVFWTRDHKLAISTQSLLPLYRAAKHAFMTAIRQYKMLHNLCTKTDRLVDETVQNRSLASENLLESEVMKHSKALLLLSCDFGSAWNGRKLVLSKKQQFSLFMDELLLSALILSYSPKSECAWSHRRWVIKTISGKFPNLQEMVEKESELVENIAEKLKMNYRAWSHRCWLISYMTKEQMLSELKKSKKWAELHVADNCCFHYRSQLMLRILEDSCLRQVPEFCSSHVPDLYQMWKEELDWGETLIRRFVGREALWVHRRFLSQCWIKHFVSGIQGFVCSCLHLVVVEANSSSSRY
ncbi:protein prenyltransferase alpha subunit repeat-containing protein 1 isoform X2 [Macadamia integrifolia]|uniref:protein prenyltransferase alpha subunit repeat-containing protein 1 isoform X2 n=1 Tax=Macadamia integrifolia TaxID=60698 RepID=UPI001C4E9CC9|nr:protein prenyltransferase alpha subunit repeat-containing protein 1 isoform X2 [Macadamia integrifolia]